MKIKYLTGGIALACALALSACGGGDDEFPDVPIGVTLINVTEPGLKLKLNGGAPADVKEDLPGFYFTERVKPNSTYKVELASATSIPANATKCEVLAGEGTVGILEPNGITVSCTLITYKLGGTISGPRAGNIVVNNGSAQVSIPKEATTFELPGVAADVPYSVTILAQSGSKCSVSPAQATPPIAAPAAIMPKADVVNLNITCI